MTPLPWKRRPAKSILNTASLAVLARLFTALTGDWSLGNRIAALVVEFRDQARAQDRMGAPPWRRPIRRPSPRSVEVDTIEGVSLQSVFRAGAPSASA